MSRFSKEGKERNNPSYVNGILSSLLYIQCDFDIMSFQDFLKVNEQRNCYIDTHSTLFITVKHETGGKNINQPSLTDISEVKSAYLDGDTERYS